MKKFTYLLPTFFLSLILFSCSSDDNVTKTEPTDTTTPVPTVSGDEPEDKVDLVDMDNVDMDNVDMDEEEYVDPSIPVLTLSFTPTKTFRFTWLTVPGATSYNIKEAITVGSGYSTTIIDTTVTADATVRSFDYIVPLYTRLNAKYMLQSCNADECAESVEVFTSTRVTEMTSSIGYFKASNTDADDYFASSVSLSKDGNTLAVGAVGEGSSSTVVNMNQDNESASGAGAVYVFTRINKTSAAWSQQAYLKAKNAGSGDRFGVSVSVSADGNTLAVGAEGEKSNGTGAGAAYVFTRSGVEWTQESYLKASAKTGNALENDKFGYRVSLNGDGDTLAVGALQEDSSALTVNGVESDTDNTGARKSGAVYVFIRAVNENNSSITWPQQAYLKARNSVQNDTFGSAVSLSANGNILAVGAQNRTNPTALYAGAAYVFTRSGVNWTQKAFLEPSHNTDSTANFGCSVSVSADGNILAVGAWAEGGSTGAVYVYTRSGEAWTERDYLNASNTESGDNFGYSVSLSTDGNTLAVGAPNEANNAFGINNKDQTNNEAEGSGAVYTFTRAADTTTWSQQAYIKSSNTGRGDKFGSSVALSADGDTLAVGANEEDGNVTGVNTDQTDGAGNAGAVYVY